MPRFTFLLILLLAPAAQHAAGQGPIAQPDEVLRNATSNPCDEGFFYDFSLSSPWHACRPLDRPVGFARLEFESGLPNRTYTLDHCSASALAAVLRTVGTAGGGIVQLPACRILVDRSLQIPSNTLLAGAGQGRTILQAAPGFDQELLRVLLAQHVVVRDLTLDGQSSAMFGLRIEYSDNVLAERLEVSGAIRNGLHFSNSRRVTLRYNRSFGQEINSGIATKDCYAESIRDQRGNPEMAVTRAMCEEHIRHLAARHGGIGPHGVLWTTDYAIYSNYLHDNRGDYGIVAHGVRGEVAGNFVAGNRRCMKFPDASDVFVHHNTCVENVLFACHIYAIIADKYPSDILFYENRFVRNGGAPFRIEGARRIYLINNYFEGNNTCVEACDTPPGAGVEALILASKDVGGLTLEPEVLICPGSEDAGLPSYGGYFPLVVPYYRHPCTTFTLPLQIISFKAVVSGTTVRLSWEADIRDGSAGFFVERRAGQGNATSPAWEEVGFLGADAPPGHTQTFSYTVDHLIPGMHTFRLRHVDADGSYAYSREILAYLPLSSTYALSNIVPNPLNNVGELDLTVGGDQYVRMVIVDMMGRTRAILFDGTAYRDEPYRFVLHAAYLPAGRYAVRVVGDLFSDTRLFSVVR